MGSPFPMHYPNPFDLGHDESEVGEMWIFDQIECAGSGRIPMSGRPGTRGNLMCKVGDSLLLTLSQNIGAITLQRGLNILLSHYGPIVSLFVGRLVI
jgi:hypothetical protein